MTFASAVGTVSRATKVVEHIAMWGRKQTLTSANEKLDKSWLCNMWSGTMAQCRLHDVSIFHFLLLSMLCGCANSAGTWGANATLTPGWARVKTAASDAVKDPKTWVPLVAAALFTIDDFDQQTVDWATRHNPLFGNVEDANKRCLHRP